ncbi:50S ribosomal protein L24 [Patescibacteria group bacterium]|nr:50S ribosomal protein L24 [Patescibacteria group bacterium]
MHVKKDDKVIILAGKDKGKTGTILKSFPRENKVIVGGLNLVKVHQKARKGGEKGQIVDRAMPIHVSNVKKTDSTPKRSAGNKSNKASAPTAKPTVKKAEKKATKK